MLVGAILLGLILIAGFYMAWNIGANDVANAMGTSVGSGALTLRRAIFIAAILEFSGAFFFGDHVSQTIQSGIVKSDFFSENPILLVYGMLSALIATGLWLQVASYFGWPVSTTHAIVGSIIGFGVTAGGVNAIYWNNVTFIVTSWVLSPLLGGVVSYFIFSLLRKKIFYSANPVKAAKQMAPLLVFIVFVTLSLIMIYNGLRNIHMHLTLFEAIATSSLFGFSGAVVTYFLVQRIKEPMHLPKIPTHEDAEIFTRLDKAKKHLQQALGSSHGEVQYQLNELVEEVDALNRTLKQGIESRDVPAEYTLVEKIFGGLQILTACLMAFAHGANDVANAIGPLSASLAVLNTGTIETYAPVPAWALALGGIGIVTGLATWGWRVIETIGRKITELTPTRGFAAEFGASATVLLASRLGLPISTTHTLVGSVIGVGLARGIEALDLSTTRDIVMSWLITVPLSAALSVSIYYCLTIIF